MSLTAGSFEISHHDDAQPTAQSNSNLQSSLFDEQFSSLSWRLSAIALPNIADYLLSTAATFFKAYILTNMSGNYLKASALIIPIELLTTYPFKSSYTALQPFFAETLPEHNTGALTEENRNKLNSIFIQSYIFTAAICVAMLPILCSMRNILLITGMDNEIAEIIGDYFQYAAIGFPAELVMQLQRQFFLSTKHALVTVPIRACRTLLDILLIYLFILVFKLPGPMIALAISVERCLVAISVAAYINLSERFRATIKPAPIMIDKELLSNISLQQIPIVLTVFTQLSSLLVYNILLGIVSPPAVEAFQTSAEITDWIVSPAYAIGSAMGVLTKELRKNNEPGQQRLVTIGAFWSQILPVLGLIITIPLSKMIAQALLYSKNEDSQKAINQMIWILPVRVFMIGIEALIQIVGGVLRGCKETKYTTYASLMGSCLIGVPFALVSTFCLENVIAILSSITLGTAVTLGTNSFFYRKKCQPTSALTTSLMTEQHTATNNPLQTDDRNISDEKAYEAPLVNFANLGSNNKSTPPALAVV